MTLNPNKYKNSVPVLLRLYEKCKHKDIHDITNEIGLGVGLDFAALCMILYKHTNDERFPAQIKMLIEFGRYDTVIEYDFTERTTDNPDDISG